MAVTLTDIIDESKKFVKEEFGFAPEKTELKVYSPENWSKFCSLNNFDPTSYGIYVPQAYSAYLHTDSPAIVPVMLHEFFGHGLFVEHSIIGKNLVDVIEKGEDQGAFLYREVDRRVQPFGLLDRNIYNYEGFAVWLEAILTKEAGLESMWEDRIKIMSDDHSHLLEMFNDVEEKMTRFGFMAQMGFPKHYDADKAGDIIRWYYGDDIGTVDFALLRGSRKPYSDIDFFVVSDNPTRNIYLGWLDIYEVNKAQFREWSKNLDISVTDPMIQGEIVYGDNNFFEAARKDIIEREITPDAVAYNLSEAERLRSFRAEAPDEEKSRLAYIDTFTQNAMQLSQGNKPLTKKALEQLYQNP